jgi:hypothetical protein
MYNHVYEIIDYQIEIEGVIENRQRIQYWNNEEDYLIEEYYGTVEEIRPGYSPIQ